MRRVIDVPGTVPTVFPPLELGEFLTYIRDVWSEGRKLQPKWWTAVKEVDLVGGFFTMLNNDERRMKSGIGFGHFIYESQDVAIDVITGMPKIIGRTDIQFAHGSTWGPMITMEFKRLNNGAKLRREYLISGMARFVSGKYAHNHDTGYMAGLVKGTTVAERAGLITSFSKNSNIKSLAMLPLTHSSYGDPSVDGPAIELDTRHQRPLGGLTPEIRIGHLLLER